MIADDVWVYEDELTGVFSAITLVIILDLIHLTAWADLPYFRKHIYYLPTGGNILGVLKLNIFEDMVAIRFI